MTKHHIDEVKTREAMEHFRQEQLPYQLGLKASDFLLWIKQNLSDGTRGRDFITVTATYRHGGYAEQGDYLQRAAEKYADQILEDAIAIAEREFNGAEQLRQDTYNARHARLRKLTK
jgi:hypothetical protein